MDLLQHLVNVDAVGFLPPALLLLVSLGNALLSLTSLLGGLSGGLWRHPDADINELNLYSSRFRVFLLYGSGHFATCDTQRFRWVRGVFLAASQVLFTHIGGSAPGPTQQKGI